MSKYRNIKIHVPTPEISEKVQVELAKHGCRRSGNRKTPANLNFPYIYVGANGTIAYSSTSEVYGFMNDEQEVPYQSILDPYYDVKIAWANGEVVQYRPLIMDDKGKMSRGEWKDWESKRDIRFRSGDHWRIKPKTKTYKQWERKFWDGENVNMARSTDKNPDWDVGFGWINEPELKEYEVPND